MPAVMTPAEADGVIAARLGLLPAEPCALERATGRVLREAVVADLDQPPFDRVAMDGIAFAHAALEGGVRTFPIEGVLGAGAPPRALAAPDGCIEVMTGAVLPPGTDTVVPVEDITVENGRAVLGPRASPSRYDNVHRRASDAPAGKQLLAPGARLRGPELAIAASVGSTLLLVNREPRIAVISTGDELVPPGSRPAAWQVRRSNAYGVAATLRGRGYTELADAHVGDDPRAIRAVLEEHLASHDVLVLSGGVSAGRFDYVPAALAELGVDRAIHNIAQRPGRPLWFGTRADGRAVFALPGNPVSTLVCLVRYVLPALERLAGAMPTPPALAPLSVAWAWKHGLTAFLPVDRRADGLLTPHPTHGSGDFSALAGTTGFVELAPGRRWEPGNLAPLYTW